MNPENSLLIQKARGCKPATSTERAIIRSHISYVIRKRFRDFEQVLRAFLLNLSLDLEPSFFFAFDIYADFFPSEELDQEIDELMMEWKVGPYPHLEVRTSEIKMGGWINPVEFWLFGNIDIANGDLESAQRIQLQVFNGNRYLGGTVIDSDPSAMTEPLNLPEESWFNRALQRLNSAQ
ncbi:MAG: hypothetical protein ACFCBU_00160 [Cyanophyceae cyanobacterium]